MHCILLGTQRLRADFLVQFVGLYFTLLVLWIMVALFWWWYAFRRYDMVVKGGKYPSNLSSSVKLTNVLTPVMYHFLLLPS